MYLFHTSPCLGREGSCSRCSLPLKCTHCSFKSQLVYLNVFIRGTGLITHKVSLNPHMIINITSVLSKNVRRQSGCAGSKSYRGGAARGDERPPDMMPLTLPSRLINTKPFGWLISTKQLKLTLLIATKKVNGKFCLCFSFEAANGSWFILFGVDNPSRWTLYICFLFCYFIPEWRQITD